MSTATLSNAPATQLTFPWAIPKAEAETSLNCSVSTLPNASAPQSLAQPANSFEESLTDQRIGKPFRVGSVMFRLLKSYGISDSEIADGIAQYEAKRRLP